MGRVIRYNRDGYIAYADTGSYVIGSERRPVGGAGWSGEQQTGAYEVVAFSLHPVGVTFAGDDPVVLAPPTAAIVPAGTPYTRRPIGACAQRTIFVGVRGDAHTEHWRSEPRTLIHCAAPACTRSLAMARQLERMLFGAEFSEAAAALEPIMIEECASRIVESSRIAARPCMRGGRTERVDTAAGRPLRDAVNRAAELLSEGPGERWSLDELSDEVGLSPGYLSRVFRSQTGHTLTRYLSIVRVAFALDRLGDERGRLTRLALRSGFSSHAHMTSVFTKLIGLPPSVLASADSHTQRETLHRLRLLLARTAQH